MKKQVNSNIRDNSIAEPSWDEKIERTYKTRGYKKLWNYYLDLSKTDYFQSKIKELRIKYLIPKDGFELDEQGSDYPKDWGLNHHDVLKILKTDLEEISNKYGLHSLDGKEVISWYLFYNEVHHDMYPNSYNLCYLEDTMEVKSDTDLVESAKDDDKFYPIAIKISPYASQRDIVDFVRNMFPLIESYQKAYQNPEIKIGRSKAKKVSERDEFIYQNREKSGKEIKKLVQEKFGDNLSYEYIPKIIFREKKKRQRA